MRARSAQASCASSAAAYMDTLSPTMRTMMEQYLACKAQYPDMSRTWQWDYNFPHQPALN